MFDKSLLRVATLVALIATPLGLGACGGGGGGGGVPPGGSTFTTAPPSTATPTVTPTPGFTASTQATSVPLPSAGSYSGTIQVPSGSGSADIATSLSNPGGTPVLQIVHSKQSRRDTVNTPLLYITFTAETAVTLNGIPGFTFTIPSGVGGPVYLAARENNIWTTFEGPVAISNGTAIFPTSSGTFTVSAGQSVYIALYEGGIVPTPAPTPTPVATTPTPSTTPTPQPGNGASLTGPLLGPGGAWGPVAVANALEFPVQSGYNGAGQTIAIVMDAYPSGSDLSAYQTYFEIPQTGRTILTESIDGGPNGSDTGAEVTLDTETIAGLAPGANIRIYGMPALNAISFDDALDQIISDGVASVANYSASGCEYANMSPTNTILSQASSLGIAIMVSAGDRGNECGANGVYSVGVGYPASDPYAVGVGGTETLPQGYALTSSRAWNDNSCVAGQCATGGGISQYWSTPSYQVGVPGASQTFRTVPDVAMPAEFTAVYFGGAWEALNGTSWSAPQFAALQAEVNEYCNTQFQLPPNNSYYVRGTSLSTFIDVVSGNNEFDGQTPYYSAGAGFDAVSGNGVPYGMPFAQTLCPNRVPAAGRRAFDFSHAPPAPTYSARVLGPSLRGLTDQGERSATALMEIQLVMRPGDAVASNESKAVAALTAAGFIIVKQFSNHLVVDAEAPTSVVEAFFSTSIHTVSQPRYANEYAPVTETTIPAVLAPYVAGAVLDNVVNMGAPL
jgi:hypothetical protein